MRKAIIAAAGVLALASVALASKPKPMDCDAWACKGEFCSPAKYQAVRHPFLPPWLFETPVYGAALTESGLLAIAILVPYGTRRRVKGTAAAPEVAGKLEIPAS